MNNKKVEVNNSSESSKYTDFHYALIESSLTNHKEVRVVFKYEGETITHYVYVREVSGKPDSYYLGEAKSKVDQAIADGTILKEFKLSNRTRKIKISRAKSSKGAKVALAFTSVVAVALAGLIAYYFLTLKKTLTISVDPNGGAFIERDSNARHSYAIKNFEVDPGYTWDQLKKEKKIEIGIMPEGGALLDGWQYYDGGAWKDITEEGVTFNDDTKVKAKYDYWSDKVTVIVDPNGAAFESGDKPTEVRTKWVTPGTVWGSIKDEFKINKDTIPEGKFHKDDYTFEYYNGHEPDIDDRWKEIGDNFPLYGTVEIKASFDPIMCQINLIDEFNGIDIHTIPQIEAMRAQDEQWREVRSEPEKWIVGHKREGYEFNDFYFYSDGGFVPVPSTQTFSEDTDIYLMWNITINFENPNPLEEVVAGDIPYATYQFLSGTKWGHIKGRFEPLINDKGYIFDKFTYKEPGGTVHDVTDDTIIDHYTTFVAHYIPDHAENFETDSWPSFLKEIGEHTYQEITERSDAPYRDEWLSNGGSFIGLEREIEIHYRKYKVRVIDENFTRDLGNDGTQERKLVFEFENELNFEVPYAQTRDADKINHYLNSTIDRYLNEDVLDALPIELSAYLLENQTKVQYYEINASKPDEGAMKVIDRSLFAPSAYEMGVKKYPPVTTSSEGKDVLPEGNHVYKFYKDADLTPEIRKKSKVEGGGQGLAVDYWLRSADIDYIYGAWQINVDDGMIGVPDGDVRYSQEITDTLAVSPVFEL